MIWVDAQLSPALAPWIEAFPRGSLKKHFTRAKAKEELVLLNGCSLEVPE